MTRPLLEPERLKRLARAAETHDLCDQCLGRFAGRVETGFANDERAAIIREGLGIDAGSAEDCEICEGLFLEIGSLAEVAIEALEPYAFDTFLVGVRIDAELAAREVAIRDEAEIPREDTEAVNTALNREVGKRVNANWPDARVDFKDPHLTVVVDTRYDTTMLQHGGIYFFGRYRKFERGLPQTIWPCRRCRGHGCARCENTGKMYASSVQELIAGPVLAATNGTEASFHGAGREDVDARCLGTGRPFILEVKDPKIRAVDPKALQDAVNAHASDRVEIEGFRSAAKAEIVRVKEYAGKKTYRAEVRFEAPVTPENLFKAVAALRGAAVAQRTPSRVEHRRADLIRDRSVHVIEIESHDAERATIRIVGDAGLYIKELVHGDEGRTQPNLAALVGASAVVDALDILDVEYEEGPR